MSNNNNHNNISNEPGIYQRFVQVHPLGTQSPHHIMVPTIVHRSPNNNDSSPFERIVVLDDFENAIGLDFSDVKFFRGPNQDRPIGLYWDFIKGYHIHWIENEVIYFDIRIIEPEGRNSATHRNKVGDSEEQVVPESIADPTQNPPINENDKDQVVPEANVDVTQESFDSDDGYGDFVYVSRTGTHSRSPSPIPFPEVAMSHHGNIRQDNIRYIENERPLYNTLQSEIDMANNNSKTETYVDPTQTLPDIKKGGDDHSTPTPPPPTLYHSASNFLPSSTSLSPPPLPRANTIPTSSPVVLSRINSEEETASNLFKTRMEHTSPILFPSRATMENASPLPSPFQGHLPSKSKVEAAADRRNHRRARRLCRIQEIEKDLNAAHRYDAVLKGELQRQRDEKQMLLREFQQEEKLEEQEPLIVYTTNTDGSSIQQQHQQQRNQQQQPLSQDQSHSDQQLHLHQQQPQQQPQQPLSQRQSYGQGPSYDQYGQGYTYSQSRSNSQPNHHDQGYNGDQRQSSGHGQFYGQGQEYSQTQTYDQGQSYGQPQSYSNVHNHDQGYNQGRTYYSSRTRSHPYPNQHNNYPSQSNSYPHQSSNYPTQSHSSQTQSNHYPSPSSNYPSPSSNNYPNQSYSNYPTQSNNYSYQNNTYPSQSNNYPTQSSNNYSTQTSNNYPSQRCYPPTSQANHPSQANNQLQGYTTTATTAVTSTNAGPSEFQSYLTKRFGYSRSGSLGVHDQKSRRNPFPLAQPQPQPQQRLLSSVPQGQNRRNPQTGGSAGVAGGYQSVQGQAYQAQGSAAADYQSVQSQTQQDQDKEQQGEPSKKKGLRKNIKRKRSSEDAEGAASGKVTENDDQVKKEEEQERKPLKRSRPSQKKDEGKCKKEDEEGEMSAEIDGDAITSFASKHEQENLTPASEVKDEEENEKEKDGNGTSSAHEPENLPDTDLDDNRPIAARTRSRSSISSCTWPSPPSSRRRKYSHK